LIKKTVFTNLCVVCINVEISHENINEGDKETGKGNGQRVEKVGLDLFKVKVGHHNAGIGAANEAIKSGKSWKTVNNGHNKKLYKVYPMSFTIIILTLITINN